MSTSTDKRYGWEDHIQNRYSGDVSMREFSALANALAFSITGEYEMPFSVRQRIQHCLTVGQKGRLLAEALATVSQRGMDPRRNDPKYPLD